MLFIVIALTHIHHSDTGSLSTQSILVEAGDSLWKIAQAHPVEGLRTDQVVDLILHANGMKSSVVYAGQVIEIPEPLQTDCGVALR